jgi:hypothetical protein
MVGGSLREKNTHSRGIDLMFFLFVGVVTPLSAIFQQ